MRKPIMIVGMIALAIAAIAQTDYKQWEVMTIKPKADKLDLFKKAMGAHTKKYHAADPYKVGILSLLTGPNSGQYAWIMGPCTWTQYDAFITKGEHDADWDKNVAPNIESFGEVAYWRLDKEINHEISNSTFTKGRVRYFTLIPGQGDRAAEQFKKIIEVYKKKGYPASYNAYWRTGASAGPHVAISISFANWAYFDTPGTFEKDFEEIHGANSWDRFLEETALCFDRTKTYDELREFVPELSSN